MLTCRLLLLFVSGGFLAAQEVPSQQGKTAPQRKPGETLPRTHPAPVTPKPGAPAATPELNAAPRFDINVLDRAVNPCVDFYQFSCGTWMRNNPIPPDESSWGRFNELQERNRAILHTILEEAAKPDPKRDAVEQKIGDYYASCMDEAAINRKGLAPLEPELRRIRELKDKAALGPEIAHLHTLGVNALFEFGSGPDDKNSKENIAQADQGGLGLPDRDYYLKTDAKSVELRRKYAQHVANTFRLLGRSPAEAERDAKVVMDIETALAKASLSRVARRDPAQVYHKMGVAELEAMDRSFAWPKYIEGIHAPPFQSLNVAVPEFFQQMQGLIASTSLADWKTYLTWHLAHAESPMLPTAFVNENFEFYGKTLTGAKQLRPRWKRCVSYVDNQLGEALGQKFVDQTFGAEGKQRTLRMVNELEKALGEDIQQLDWMTPATKRQAMVKLHGITNKIGYPDKWRDYSKYKVTRGDALGNAERGDEFEFHRQVAKIGTPVDRGEWFMSPPTVNAYYDPQMNNINFPAGILQPPFYDNQIDDAVNFGGIGAVIGHELTHGFDDEGRHFDAQGNLRDWWTPEDAKAFEQRAQCFVDEYSGFTVDGGVHLNGKLTLGENTADNGGVRLALMALMARLAGKTVAPIDGFTPEQRVFLGWGQIWCQNQTPENARLRATVDPHSPGRDRVNGVLRNMPEFRKAFGCTAGQPMVSRRECRVW